MLCIFKITKSAMTLLIKSHFIVKSKVKQTCVPAFKKITVSLLIQVSITVEILRISCDKSVFEY